MDNELQAVTSNNPATSDWAVGDYSTTTNRQTLVENILPPTPPLITRSYYEQQVDIATHTAQGCSAAQTPISGGIVVLDYGQPWKDPNSGFGTHLIYPTAYPFVKIGQIESAVKAFADGYATCVPSYSGRRVTIAVAVHNSVSSHLNSDHGVAWAAMIKGLQATFTPVPQISFAGGLDAEPGAGFDPTYTATEDWAQGFLSIGRAPYYNFGSPDSYPYRPTPGPQTPTPVIPEPWITHDPWNTDHYYQISYGLKPGRVYALPQTYTSFKTGYWYTIARYGIDRYQDKMVFTGQVGSSNVPLTPALGWRVLWLALAGDSATYHSYMFDSTLQIYSGP